MRASSAFGHRSNTALQDERGRAQTSAQRCATTRHNDIFTLPLFHCGGREASPRPHCEKRHKRLIKKQNKTKSAKRQARCAASRDGRQARTDDVGHAQVVDGPQTVLCFKATRRRSFRLPPQKKETDGNQQDTLFRALRRRTKKQGIHRWEKCLSK